MQSMFEDAFSFNRSIGGWDVSSAAISSMFYNASIFNQNLSGWYVESYSSEPTNFSTNSAFLIVTCLSGGNPVPARKSYQLNNYLLTNLSNPNPAGSAFRVFLF